MKDFATPKYTPPKPSSRPEGAGWIERIRLFRKDVFSSQPERLYAAKMAHVKTPAFDSFLINSPDDVQEVLSAPNSDFPKSTLVSSGLRDLLGNSVFVANGTEWAQARRIIDTVFDGPRMKSSFPAIVAAGEDAKKRLSAMQGPVDIEAEASRITADVMFRVMFSRRITDLDAARVFEAFQNYQRTQPLWNFADMLRLPKWFPRFRSRQARQSAGQIRRMLGELIDRRVASRGPRPDDILTGLISSEGNSDNAGFSREELIDQTAIFFLAGHETSASALSWALFLLSCDEDAQRRVAQEASKFDNSFAKLSTLRFTRNVFRETLRLYPPVPMMLRDAGTDWKVRGRTVKKGSLIVLSAWHLGRHKHHWGEPDAFDPDRWDLPTTRFAHIPFSAGPRVCSGAGFAMAEGVALIAQLVRAFDMETIPERTPVPVAHLTLRSKDGIWLNLSPRNSCFACSESSK